MIGPDPTDFAAHPAGWAGFASCAEISRTPVSRQFFGRTVVAYRTSAGNAIAMDGRCWHMGANLGDGEVDGDCLRCPFHGWAFAPDGTCDRSQDAHQTIFATSEKAGRVYVFPSAVPTHPLPWFDVPPEDLLAAPPFSFKIRCPWWLVGTNGFDLQHFSGAHDRRLISSPVITSPHPSARRIVADFEVVGNTWRDRLTRRFSGQQVTMDVTNWAGSLVFVKASFPRGASYGLVEIQPAGKRSTLVRITIFVRRKSILDWFDVRIRRSFIRAFLEPDTRLLDRAVYHPHRLTKDDQVMAEYLAWLATLSRRQLLQEIADEPQKPCLSDSVPDPGICLRADNRTVER